MIRVETISRKKSGINIMVFIPILVNLRNLEKHVGERSRLGYFKARISWYTTELHCRIARSTNSIS